MTVELCGRVGGLCEEGPAALLCDACGSLSYLKKKSGSSMSSIESSLSHSSPSLVRAGGMADVELEAEG